ncbi:hypothetical protein AB4K20DRAFT_1918638 [Rhizopus microsporus]
MYLFFQELKIKIAVQNNVKRLLHKDLFDIDYIEKRITLEQAKATEKLESSFTETVQHIAWIHPSQDENIF